MSDKASPIYTSALTGKVVGSYRFDTLIGEGGMAWVYRATELETEQLVAIKVLRETRQSTGQARSRFLREAKIQSALSHEHIVKVIDVIEEQELVGFVQEWCAGGDLQQLLDRLSGPVPLEMLHSHFLPIVKAVAYAHQRQLVHRDIKPANILLVPSADGDIAKLNDFGLVKVEEMHSLTSTGAVMGTVHYMAPEQFQEAKEVDHRADIYSLGVLLYRMATGRLPFTGRMPALGMKILRSAPSKPREAPKALHGVILQSLAKHPDERFESCDDFYHSLCQAISEVRPEEVDDTLSMETKDFHQAGLSAPLPSSLVEGKDASFGSSHGDFHTMASAPEEKPRVGRTGTKQAPTPFKRTAPQEAMPSEDESAALATGATSVAFPWVWVALALVALWLGVWFVWPSPSQAPHKEDAGVSAQQVRTSPVLRDGPQKRPQGRPVLRRLALRPAPSEPPLRRLILPDQAPEIRRKLPGPITPNRTPPLALVPEKTPRLPTSRPSPKRQVVSASKSPAVPAVIHQAPKKLSTQEQKAATWLHRAVRFYAGKDFVEARKWMRRSCGLKNGMACYQLAVMLKDGKGGTIDLKESVVLLERSCSYGLAKGCHSAGQVYISGEGAAKDIKKARKLLGAACMGLHTLACASYANMLARGLGGPRKLPIAIRLHKRLCESDTQSAAWSCLSLMQIFASGMGGKKDYKQAAVYAKKACERKNARACGELGSFYHQGKLGGADAVKSLYWYKKSCQLKSGAGCFIVAIFHQRGLAGAKQPKEARKMAKQACALGDNDGCALLGEFLTTGKGGPRSCERANQVFRKACRMGHTKACQMFCTDNPVPRAKKPPIEDDLPW